MHSNYLLERLARLERVTLTFGGLCSNPTELQAHIARLFYTFHRILSLDTFANEYIILVKKENIAYATSTFTWSFA